MLCLFILSACAYNDVSPWRFYSYDQLDLMEMVQDPQGNTWLSIGGGSIKNYGALLEYNGAWQQSLIDNDSSIHASNLRIEANGTKWLSFEHNLVSQVLAKVDAAGLTLFDNIAGVNDILIDRNGNKWISSNTDVVKYDGANWTTYSSVCDLSAGLLLEDGQGNIWCTCYTGVTKFDGHSWTTYSAADGAPSLVGAAAVDKYGSIWFQESDGFVKYDGKDFIPIDRPAVGSDLYYPSLGTLNSDAAGNLWILGVTKIYEIPKLLKFDGQIWSATEVPFNSDQCRYGGDLLAIDRQDNKWIAVSVNGIYVMRH